MKIVNRSDLSHIEEYLEIFEAEKHHTHRVVEIDGITRWEENEAINSLVDASGLNLIVRGLYENGYDKNSEVYRELYRNMGYSLSGYWEIFYWDLNNENAGDYRIFK